MKIPNTQLEFRQMVTKTELHVDILHNEFNEKILKLMGNTCRSLMDVLKCEIMLLESVEVKAIAMDDLRMLQRNFKTLVTALELKELKFEKFCFN